MKNDIFNDVCLAFDKVEEAVKANSDVYGVKFHGIVESPANDLKYKSASKSCGYVNQLITPSKGIALDITDNKTVDYSPMIESVIKTTAVSVPELLYQLPATAKVIKSIVIDGEEFKGDYTFDKDGTLRIRGVSQDVERKIIVNFEG
jgi:hypothetical protein